MKKIKQPGKMVRLSDYTAMLLSDITPATEAYWAHLDKKAGREPQKLTASDVIRTSLGQLEEMLEQHGFLKAEKPKS